MISNGIYGDYADILFDNEVVSPSSVDLVATDPPYEIGIADWDKEGEIDWAHLSYTIYDKLKYNGQLIMFSGWTHEPKIREIFTKRGFILKSVIAWDRIKGRGTKKTLVSTLELILWFVKDEKNYTYNKIPSTIKKKTGGMGLKNKNPYRAMSNVWTDIPPIVPWSKERVDHPTQKPLFLMERIIKIWSNKGDLVLDPFMGSGTTWEACSNLQRGFIGTEISKKDIITAKKRLNVSHDINK